MKTPYLFAALALFSTTAFAQTVYEPVRYQYGERADIYYGGNNPMYANHANPYLPPGFQTLGPQGVSPYVSIAPMPITPVPSSVVPQPAQVTYPMFLPRVYSDYFPYEEAGLVGYTPDDARNEAYENVARIQTNGGRIEVTAPSPAPAQSTAAAPAASASPAAAKTTDPRLKAIPLLDWAKAEQTKNPALYKELLRIARQYDPKATETFQRNLATEK